MKIRLICLMLTATAVLFSCVGDSRCGDDLVLDDNGQCLPITGGLPDGGMTDGGGGTLPSGMGDMCDNDSEDCSGNEADYCLMQPGQPDGYCTLADCSTDPDDCPDGYTCCVFTLGGGFPDFCATDSDYMAMSGMDLCE